MVNTFNCPICGRFSTSFYRLGLHQLISDPMGTLIKINFSGNMRLLRHFCSVKSSTFFKNCHKLPYQKKNFDYFLFYFYHSDIWMILKLFLLYLPWRQPFFSIGVILDFVFISKKGFAVFQKILLTVISLVLILLKKLLFSLLIKPTQTFCCFL